jgi:uncharacterized protein DUF6979
MTKYGEAAVMAARAADQSGIAPARAWTDAVSVLYANSEWGRKKSCPKHAFLGLCEAGVIRGVPPGQYAAHRSGSNKEFTMRALEAVRQDPALLLQKSRLWEIATDGSGVGENGQLGVLESLRSAGLLR